MICWPLVIGRFETVAQKLMKLFVDVSEATWPASATSWPLFAKPLAMTESRSAVGLSQASVESGVRS